MKKKNTFQKRFSAGVVAVLFLNLMLAPQISLFAATAGMIDPALSTTTQVVAANSPTVSSGQQTEAISSVAAFESAGPLSTATLPPLPAGYTRAVSNINFAYRVYAVPVPQRPSTTTNLEIVDLRTGRIKTVASAYTVNSESLHDVDVLPDTTEGGSVVIYKKTHTSGLYDSINLVRFSTLQSYQLPYGYRNPILGNLGSYKFSNHDIKFAFTSGEVVTFELAAFTVIGTSSKSAYNTNTLTNLPENATLGSGQRSYDHGVMITTTQSLSSSYSFNYALPQAGDFAFSTINFESANFGSALTLGLNGPAGKQVKVELFDGLTKAIFYADLSGSMKNYSFSLTPANVPAGFNSAYIRQIVLVVEQARSGNSGTIQVNTKGWNYIPVISGTAYNTAALTSLPATPGLFTGAGGAFGNNKGVISQVQNSATSFDFSYKLSHEDEFVFSGIQFSAPKNLGTALTIALNGPAAEQIKVEIKDMNGRVAKFYVQLTGAMKNYSLALTGSNVPAGFNHQLVKEIVFVAEPSRSGGEGIIQVGTKGLSYKVPVVLQPSTPSVNWVTPGGVWPDKASVAASPATAAMEDVVYTSDNHRLKENYRLTYNTSSVGWAGGGYSYDDGHTVAVETINIASMSNLVFGLKGSTDSIKLEVIDDQNKKAVIYLKGIRTDVELFWTIPTAQLKGIDLTKIKLIYFIVEGFNKSGSVNITLQKDHSVMINKIDASGNILEAILTKGRLVYKVSVIGTTINITENDPLHPDKISISNAVLKTIEAVGNQLSYSGTVLLFQIEKIQPNGKRVRESGILVYNDGIQKTEYAPLLAAASNASFAFYDGVSIDCGSSYGSRYCGSKLVVFNLATGTSVRLASSGGLSDRHGYAPAYDVSADGRFVVFEAWGFPYPQQGTLIVQDLNGKWGDLTGMRIQIPSSQYSSAGLKYAKFTGVSKSSATIRVQDSNGKFKTITVNLLTGAVTVL